jgi:hypothetical protein
LLPQQPQTSVLRFHPKNDGCHPQSTYRCLVLVQLVTSLDSTIVEDFNKNI